MSLKKIEIPPGVTEVVNLCNLGIAALQIISQFCRNGRQTMVDPSVGHVLAARSLNDFVVKNDCIWPVWLRSDHPQSVQ